MNFQGRNFPWKGIAASLFSIACGVGASVLRSGSLAGSCEVLVVAFGCVWGFVLIRALIHLYEGYLWKGLFWAASLEIVTVVVWALLVGVVAGERNPQVVRLGVFATVACILFFVSTGELERSRDDLSKREGGVRLRRATEVVKKSWIWGHLCDLFKSLDTEPTESVREWIAEEDAKDGRWSRAGLALLTVLALLVLTTGFLAIGGTVLGFPLTPPTPDKGGETESAEKEDEAGEGGDETGSGGGSDRGGGGSDAEGSEGSTAPSSHRADCALEFDPGPNVPEPERASLMRAWHEVEGVEPGPLEALGFDIGGCPGKAWPIPGKPSWWYASGYCESNLRALAIAPAGAERPVVLLEQAAEFALPLIQEKEFLDAVERFTVGTGDAYVIDATTGSFVLIRARNGAGSVDPGATGTGCNHFTSRDVPYTVLPPSLIPGWRSVAAISSGGVYPIAVTHPSGDYEAFIFVSAEGVEAEGRCWHDGADCGVRLEGRWVMGESTETNQSEVEALVAP